MRDGNAASFLPTLQQQWLLQAALLHTPKAVKAWECWRASVDCNQLDPGAQRLLPLVYRNLRAQNVKDPLLEQLKSVYQYTWFANQVLFHHLTTLLRHFQEAGIETLLLKGIALVLLYYRDYGVRPMEDGDVLVHSSQTAAAIHILERLGWTSSEGFSASALSVRHGCSFTDAAGRALDLHWHVLHDGCSTRVDEEFWKAAMPVTFNGIASHTLNPTDLLLHVCVHGARWSLEPTIRWAADAMTVLRSPEAVIDWERLLKHARTYRLILPLRDMLQYLGAVLDAPIPATVVAELQRMPVSRAERIEYNYKTHDHRCKWLGYFPILWFDYRRSEGYVQASYKLLGFLRYLQCWWDLRSVWQTPGYGVSLGWRKLSRLLFKTNNPSLPPAS